MVDGQGDGVYDAAQTDVQQVPGGLLEVAVGVEFRTQVVGARAETGIGTKSLYCHQYFAACRRPGRCWSTTLGYLQDMVDTAVQLLGFLEQMVQLGPVGNVRLDKSGRGAGRFSGGSNIGVDNGSAERKQESDGSETDAR